MSKTKERLTDEELRSKIRKLKTGEKINILSAKGCAWTDAMKMPTGRFVIVDSELIDGYAVYYQRHLGAFDVERLVRYYNAFQGEHYPRWNKYPDKFTQQELDWIEERKDETKGR